MTSKTDLERVAEDDFVDYAATRKCWALKMVIEGWRNWPDRQILCPTGHVFYIEFKRLGKEPRKAQLYRFRKMREKGFRVYVCDTLEEAIDILEGELLLSC